MRGLGWIWSNQRFRDWDLATSGQNRAPDLTKSSRRSGRSRPAIIYGHGQRAEPQDNVIAYGRSVSIPTLPSADRKLGAASMATVIASITLGLAALLDVIATVLLVRSTVATPRQKALQLVVIWLIPFVGSIIVIAILRETTSTRRARLASGSADEWLPGSGPESESHPGHHGEHGGGGDVGHGGDTGFGGH